MSEDMAKFMDECGLSSRNSIKARLKMEESQLRLSDRYGEDARINFYATFYPSDGPSWQDRDYG